MSNDTLYFALRFALPARLAERFLRIVLIAAGSTLLSGSHRSVPPSPVELFRFRGSSTLEFVFETDHAAVPKIASKERVAEIAADFMTTLYGVQIGALETQEFRTTPIPFWLVCFSDTVTGPRRQLFFVVVLPDGTVVEPKVAKRL
jgi:hypothetical protein